MRRLLCLTILAGLLATTSYASARERCYQVSKKPGLWAKTPELLCVERTKGGPYHITLQTGLMRARQVARFNLDLLLRVRCIDCNKDVFGLRNPSNSTFNALKIEFDGKRDIKKRTEKGTVTIGGTKLYYRYYPSKRPPTGKAPRPAKKARKK